MTLTVIFAVIAVLFLIAAAYFVITSVSKSDYSRLEYEITDLEKKKEDAISVAESHGLKVKELEIEIADLRDTIKYLRGNIEQELKSVHESNLESLRIENKRILNYYTSGPGSNIQIEKIGFKSDKLAPLVVNDYDIGDIHFFGRSFDYVVFKNANAFEDEDCEIVFVEVSKSKKVASVLANKDKWNDHVTHNPITAFHSGNAGYRKNRLVKAIQDGKVRFEVWMIDEDGVIHKETAGPDNKCNLL